MWLMIYLWLRITRLIVLGLMRLRLFVWDWVRQMTLRVGKGWWFLSLIRWVWRWVFRLGRSTMMPVFVGLAPLILSRVLGAASGFSVAILRGIPLLLLRVLGTLSLSVQLGMTRSQFAVLALRLLSWLSRLFLGCLIGRLFWLVMVTGLVALFHLLLLST